MYKTTFKNKAKTEWKTTKNEKVKTEKIYKKSNTSQEKKEK